jgi:endonuclease/exonuclease/phosphatase family metal-dependent hydrolase
MSHRVDSTRPSAFAPPALVADLRLATWNIHKGVRGVGPLKSLEIHGIAHAVAALDADIVCLQEVRAFNHREARRFAHWPSQPQADVLAPEGYRAVYRTNAVTRDGEHGNALLSRWPVLSVQQQDISDHRLEQRGLLHVQLQPPGWAQPLHVLVLHLGLVPGSRARQIQAVLAYVAAQVPRTASLVLAGDFNAWGRGLTHTLARAGLHAHEVGRHRTFPARLPVVQLDYIYTRHLRAQSVHVAKGGRLARLSDHLPLLGQYQLAPA